MRHLAEHQLLNSPTTTFFCKATVIDVSPDGGEVQLRRDDPQARSIDWAIKALPTQHRPMAGDIVLVTGDEHELFVMGILPSALVSLLPRALAIRSKHLDLVTKQSDVQMDQVKLVSRRISCEAQEARISAKRIETTADTFVERVGSVYRTARDLVQLQAGRVRTLVSGMLQQRSNQASLSSEEDFKINGEKIHLG